VWRKVREVLALRAKPYALGKSRALGTNNSSEDGGGLQEKSVHPESSSKGCAVETKVRTRDQTLGKGRGGGLDKNSVDWPTNVIRERT